LAPDISLTVQENVMSWIELPADDATPELARATKAWRDDGRSVPAVVAPLKQSVKAMRAVLQMNSAVTFGGSGLGRRREEMVATTVSALNGCFY
jgi:alkylhydroperoxidase family enzyme